MQQKITAIFLDGQYDTTQIDFYRRHAGAADFLIAADGGVNFLNALDLVPDLLVGDGDGADFSQARAKEVKRKTEQNKTDGELAVLEAIERRPENRINIYGGLTRASEADQFYGNLGLLYLSGRAVLRDPKQDIYIVSAQRPLVIIGEIGDILSLAPYGVERVEKAKTSGAKWEVKDNIFPGSSKYLRNKFAEREVRISVGRGSLLAFHGKLSSPLSYPV